MQLRGGHDFSSARRPVAQRAPLHDPAHRAGYERHRSEEPVLYRTLDAHIFKLLQMGVELVVAGKLLGCFPEISIDHWVESKDLAVLSGLRGLPRFEPLALTREGVAPKRADRGAGGSLARESQGPTSSTLR